MADPSSMDDWAVILGGETPNTANIGRIWTDKTVSTDTITTSSGSVINRGDSAFITALSAFSSTSNVKSSSTTPLDIVLVLDASGSMDDSMDDGTKRIDALKSAANNFVNHIAEQNQGISDSSKQHQVSIVKFSGDKSAAVGNDTYYRGGYKYNYSQVMKAMSPCTDAAAFRNTINSINPAGSTRADYGLQLADSQTSNREDAKKIVIFFTDGSPTSSSGFESEVASSAVSAAKAMKDKKATVYTVGIFSGADPSADPSGASNENKFMHAVSSNYPEAAYTQNSGFWGGWDWNLGTRPDGSDFYKSATNADELKKVFDDISSEIVKGSGYPTNATEGAEHTSGYITFDDALGAYMQVDSFKAIALNGQTFENPTKTTAGNVDTYTFDGTVAMGDKSVSLGNVVITVTKSTDLAVGDKVQVKVPAALIPLHSYNVDQKSMTMTVSDTKPINVVYTSSLKPGVESLLANPDDAMSEYLQANSQEGKASFYSNDWKQGYLGNTIANFEPSSDNIYYYFTSDTPIYTDEACTQRAHQVVAGNTYWYKYSYYEMTDAGSGAVEEKEKVVSFSGADAEAIEGSIGVNNQGAYFKAGTVRLTYLNNLYKAKDNNATGTANDVLNPKWVGAGQVGAYLGNNGKLSVDLPGTLAVTKELKVPDGYSANDFADDSFEFTVAMPDGANKSFSAVVKNANGEQQGDAFTLKFDEEGKASHNLKAGETLYVYGLAGGWNYTVTESDRDGFTQAGTGLTGTITAGGTANAKVVNTYSASGTLKGEDSLKGEKVLTGRDWNSTDKFTFLLEASEGSVGVPMPEGANNGKATVEVTQDGASADTPVSFNFGDITYTKPGVYTYEIRESKELSVFNPGVSASKALYEVVVTVTDEGHDGTLTVKSELTKKYDDDGVKLDNPEGATVAKFVNEYNTKEVKWSPSGVKLYTDATGSRPLEAGMFHVIACTNDPKAPLPQLQGDQEINDERDGVKWRGAVTSVEADGTILFPQATFTYDDLDLGQSEKTFTYKIIEVVKDGDKWRSVEDALAPNFTSAGVTYDPIIWTVEVTLKDDNGTLVLDTKCSNGLLAGGSSGVPVMFRFNNSYAASGEVGITATKSLTGRSLTDGEFDFALKYFSGIEDVAAATNDASGNVDFGSIKYTTEGLAKLVTDHNAVKTVKDGKPAWKIDYVAYEKTDVLPGGVSAQTQPIVFTVMVVDNGDGTLAATANTGNGLKFQNVYSTGDPVSVDLSGKKVLKSDAGLTPASIKDKFTFTVTPDDPAAPKPEHATATNDANGNVDFGSIKFTLDDLNKALGSNGTRAADADDETKGASSGEAATGAAGQSTSDQGSAAGADSEEQGNAAASDGTEQGQGAAVVTGEGTGGASVSTAANKVAGTEDADQASAQSDEPATRAGVVRSHTFTYKVTESGSADGVTNDTETKTVSFKVTDDGNGKLTVERLGAASDPAFTFTNTYSVQPVDSSVTDQVTVTKNLTGRDMKAGEFEFQLLEGGNVVATGTNDASGKVALSPITYTKPGTYNYTLCEVGGGSQKAGVQYDGSTFAVTTTVTDNGDGTLSVAHKVDNDANTVGFTNSYTPAATSVTLGASKVLNGKSLDAEEFAFVLTDEGGEQVTATNDVNGMVVFPAIQYGEAGTYRYTIAEVKGDESDVTYDESEYAVTVTVEDNREGSLVATVAYKGGNAPVFTNTYNAPEAPASPGDGPASVVDALVSGSAKTGDYLLVIAGVAAAVAAAAAAVAVVSHRKKGKHAKR